MSDLTATSCGCNNAPSNDCGCGNFLWIIILFCLCGNGGFGGFNICGGGNNDGCGCGNGCGSNILWILILLCCC